MQLNALRLEPGGHAGGHDALAHLHGSWLALPLLSLGQKTRGPKLAVVVKTVLASHFGW